MSAPPREEQARKILLDEYAALKRGAAARRIEEIERLLGLGKYRSDARRAKGG